MSAVSGTNQRYVQLAATGAAAILLVQAAHMVEHVAQVTQKFIIHMPAAHGLLGSIFNLEWVHFVYNTVLYAALLAVYAWYRRAGPGRGSRSPSASPRVPAGRTSTRAATKTSSWPTAMDRTASLRNDGQAHF